MFANSRFTECSTSSVVAVGPCLPIIRLTLHPAPRTTKSPITGEVFFFCREPFCFANNKNPLSQLSRFIIVAFTSSSPLSRIYCRLGFLSVQVVNVNGVVYFLRGKEREWLVYVLFCSNAGYSLFGTALS